MRREQRLARFGQLAVGERELLVGRFELRDEARLALAEQRHVVGFLLHLLRFVVLGRHVEEHDPGRVLVGEQMDVGDAPARHFHGAEQKRRFRQRQQAFEKRQLLRRPAAVLQVREP